MDNGQAQVQQVSDRIRFDLLSPSKVRSKESSFVPPLSLSMPPRGLGRSAVLTSDIAVPFVSRRLVVLPCGWNLLPLVLLLAPSAQCWSGFVHSFRPGLSIRRRSAISLRQPRSASSSSYVSSVNSGAAAPTSTSSPACLGYSVRDSFALIVLGDLHLEDDLTCHRQARDDCLHALKQLSLLPTPQPPPPPAPLVGGDNGSSDSRRGATDTATPPITVQELLKELDDARAGDLSEAQLELLLARRRDGDLLQCYMASLGDLGRKDIRHLPGDAGTTQSFLDAKEYLDSFGIPYELVSGNHDLEGLDEFDNDEDNLKAWMNCFNKPTPHFYRKIGERTILIGLSTVRFRSAPFSSHEVHIDDAQIEWFLQTLKEHPAEDGWKVLVCSHAPIMGSGLRVLQNVHVTNGCAWLNHCSDTTRGAFLRAVQDHQQVKLWFSGHFHLSHDYQDAISTVGSCTFVQAGVVGPASTRDGRRQTRLVRGCSTMLQIYTINHHLRNDDDGSAVLRLDAEIDLASGTVTMAHGNQDYDHADWFQAYSPAAEDGCYIETPDGAIADADSLDSKVCWWHMADGKVIGLHQGQVVEYDAETLSPLGIVVNKQALGGREVVVVANGTALVLVDQHTKAFEIVHPNEDGSYWRKYQRNKKVRQEEKAREAIARMWLEQQQL